MRRYHVLYKHCTRHDPTIARYHVRQWSTLSTNASHIDLVLLEVCKGGTRLREDATAGKDKRAL